MLRTESLFLSDIFIDIFYLQAGYDLDQVLVLCQMYNFKAGILFLYEKAKLWVTIKQYTVHNACICVCIYLCVHAVSQIWIETI